MNKYEKRLKLLEEANHVGSRSDPAAIFHYAVHMGVSNVPSPLRLDETTPEYLKRWSTQSLHELMDTYA